MAFIEKFNLSKTTVNQGNLIMFPRTVALFMGDNILSLIVESIALINIFLALILKITTEYEILSTYLLVT